MNIPYFKQQKDYYCGSAVMQMVLASFGIKKSQSTLARELKTKNDNIGTKNSEMVRLSRKYLANIKSKQKTTISELKKYLDKGSIIIVSYFYVLDKTGHFAIVKKITKSRIYLIDPATGPNTRYSLKHFKKIWHDNEKTRGWHLILKK